MNTDQAAAQESWPGVLTAGLAELGIVLDAAQRETLLAYLRLLAKWNRAFNLTAIRDPREMVPRQLLDSLSVLPQLRGRRVLDVGSGAGLPGVPLAVARPDAAFVLLDANGKKVRFLRQAVLELGLANVAPVQARVEAYRPTERVDTIVSRAFASLGDMVRASARLLAPDGRWVAMKGPGERVERRDLPAGLHVDSVAVALPGLRADRRLVIIEPA
jgi:16S rRNA (guanine527-N7)-methyltransferase